MQRNNRNSRRAFTVVELMIVLVIIGLIGAIVGINLVGAGDTARQQQTEAQMKQIASVLKMYRGTHGSYPIGNGPGGLDVLKITNLMEEVPLDGWGRPFEYYSDGVAYEIISPGQSLDDDTDDIIESTKHQ